MLTIDPKVRAFRGTAVLPVRDSWWRKHLDGRIMTHPGEVTLSAPGIPADVLDDYLIRVEDDFQSLRQVIQGLSAITLLLHSKDAKNNYNLEIVINELAARISSTRERISSIENRYAVHVAHRSLRKSGTAAAVACGKLLSAFRAPASERGEAIRKSLLLTQEAYLCLKKFSDLTPWSTATIANSCAQMISEEQR